MGSTFHEKFRIIFFFSEHACQFIIIWDVTKKYVCVFFITNIIIYTRTFTKNYCKQIGASSIILMMKQKSFCNKLLLLNENRVNNKKIKSYYCMSDTKIQFSNLKLMLARIIFYYLVYVL
jgi:hypothetical protein